MGRKSLEGRAGFVSGYRSFGFVCRGGSGGFAVDVRT